MIPASQASIRAFRRLAVAGASSAAVSAPGAVTRVIVDTPVA